MKKLLVAIVVIFILLFILYFTRKQVVVVAPPVVEDTLPIELCFARFSPLNERGLSDGYTLRMLLDGGKVTGELKLLPAETDSKVGKFEGTVGEVDKIMMARTADIWWDTLAEGMDTKEELKIVFGEGTASIGFGEMVDRGDGVYVYKDFQDINYSLNLTDVSCTDLTERENVESYLRTNIATLSPVKTVLGGKWYVTSMIIDVRENSGTVTYEDGHIQEKKNFSYTIDDKQKVLGLKIK